MKLTKGQWFRLFGYPIALLVLGFLLDAWYGGGGNPDKLPGGVSLAFFVSGWYGIGLIRDGIKAKRAAKSNAKADPDASAPPGS